MIKPLFKCICAIVRRAMRFVKIGGVHSDTLGGRGGQGGIARGIVKCGAHEKSQSRYNMLLLPAQGAPDHRTRTALLGCPCSLAFDIFFFLKEDP